MRDIFNGVKPKVNTIYSRGDEGLLSGSVTRLAMVGSRRMSDYGRRVIEEWVPILVQMGIVTVSGLMTGVDQRIHEETIACGGKTIGIAGWGLDWSKDTNIVKLQTKIVQADGLLISEYKSDTVPQLWMFPARNRLVAWISDAVLVIEAGEKSGSLITANWAKKYNKKLLVVPGSVFSSVSKGANLLIKEGAVMVRNPQEILSVIARTNGTKQSRDPFEFPLRKGEGRNLDRHVGIPPRDDEKENNAPCSSTTCPPLPPSTLRVAMRAGNLGGGRGSYGLEKQILVALESGPKMIDEMVKILDEPAEKLSARLTMMEIMGEVKNRNGKYYI